jgi:4-amino-4-deoxy-L-arabinose transferase-like glycosyltransferase
MIEVQAVAIDESRVTSDSTAGGSSIPRAGRIRQFVLAGFVLVCLYGIHLAYCEHSALPYLAYVFTNSDMNANLHAAAGIRAQGWLNPYPYHPYTTWMQGIAPYSQWVQWWGGERIFQQSPLYVYLLALSPNNYFWARIAQAVLSAGLCVLLGLFTARLAGRTAGWIAFWLAALYAPFYVYSWALLRDGLGWFITAALLLALVELTCSDWSSGAAQRLGWAVGLLLGLGYLARETFLLLIPIVCVALAIFAWKRRGWAIVARVAIALILTISPLVLRNYCVGVPLLSSSNRFAETFIQGNAAGSHPYIFVIPRETRQILYETQGKTLPVIQATIASHHSLWHWLRFQSLKFLSLLDPYESPDNLSFYFMETISPVVRLGLRYWMILVPALAGLSVTLYRREYVQLWLWLYLPVVLASIVVAPPLSRYRQSLAIVFIPWAAYFLSYLFSLIRERRALLAGCWGIALLLGWCLVLGPLARQARQRYERPAEYLITAEIYQKLGNEDGFSRTEAEIRQKFGILGP